MVRLRSFGKYSFRVVDSPLLINTLVGTQGKYTTEEVASYLKDLIVARLADLLGTLKIGLLDLPSKYDEVAAGTRAKLADEFAKYGLELVDFFINAITPPEEVQKAIDARSAMGAVGDLNAFMKFQAANSMAKLAEQGGRRRHGRRSDGHGHGRRLRHDDARHDPAGDGQLAGGRSRRAGLPQPLWRDPKAAVRAVATAAGYVVAESGGALQITVPVGPLRKQVVNVEFGQADPAGHATINYWSVCGPYVEKNAAELLRYNTGTLHGAFAVKKVGDGRHGRSCRPTSWPKPSTPLDISRVLSAIAWQADQIEQKLVGGDEN